MYQNCLSTKNVLAAVGNDVDADYVDGMALASPG